MSLVQCFYSSPVNLYPILYIRDKTIRRKLAFSALHCLRFKSSQEGPTPHVMCSPPTMRFISFCGQQRSHLTALCLCFMNALERKQVGGFGVARQCGLISLIIRGLFGGASLQGKYKSQYENRVYYIITFNRYLQYCNHKLNVTIKIIMTASF